MVTRDLHPTVETTGDEPEDAFESHTFHSAIIKFLHSCHNIGELKYWTADSPKKDICAYQRSYLELRLTCSAHD